MVFLLRLFNVNGGIFVLIFHFYQYLAANRRNGKGLWKAQQFIFGANIAAFKRVADAMIEQGVV